MFPIGSRVIAIKTIVAGGEGLSLPATPDLDPASRFFVHANLGDEGFVVEDHAARSGTGRARRYDARWLVHFKRTDNPVYCDPSEVTAWHDHTEAGTVTMSSLSFGITSIAVESDVDGRWRLVSTLPHDDHRGAHDVDHDETYDNIEAAKATAELLAVKEHLAAVEIHRTHLKMVSRISDMSELEAQLVVEKKLHEILRLRLEQAEMQARLDALKVKPWS